MAKVFPANSFMTPEGGFAVRMINKTGATSVKGYVVDQSSTDDRAVDLIVVDIPDVFGVIWNSGVPDGSYVWVVISGVADVYYIGNTTRKYFARGFLTADGAGYVEGQALAEAVPTSPFASDKHFYEIGHVLESRVGEGLAKTMLHFN